MVNELIEVKWGKVSINYFEEAEINEIMNNMYNIRSTYNFLLT